MKFLLDTNVVSEGRRRRPDPGVARWLRNAPSGDLFVSVLVLGEMRKGVEALRPRDPARAQEHESWLIQLATVYEGRILTVTEAVADAWGRLNATRTLPSTDSLMLATAAVHGLTFVTRNTADVARTAVPVLNPFSA